MPTLSSTTDHAARSPSWRWQAAVNGAESQCFQPCHEDQGINAARRFWNAWRQCRSDSDRARLGQRMPKVFAAFSLHGAAGLMRDAVEARILADESLAKIAAKTGQSANVIRTYEDLFFDVRCRLSCPDYIFSEVLGLDQFHIKTRIHSEFLYRFFGYIGGAATLDALMDTALALKNKPTNDNEVNQFLSDDATRVLVRTMAIAARFRSANPELLLAAKLKQVLEAQSEAGSELEKHLKTFIEGIPWLVGAEPGTHPAQKSLERYDQAAAELRDDELFAVAGGEDTAEFDKEYFAVKIPPSRPDAGTAALAAPLSLTAPEPPAAPSRSKPNAPPAGSPPAPQTPPAKPQSRRRAFVQR